MLVQSAFFMNLKYNQKVNYQNEYDRLVLSLGNFSRLRCPSCGSVGNLRKYQTYTRFFFNSPQDRLNSTHITIQCVKCHTQGCGHTHALLPNWICPYSSYSYSFIITVLNAFYTTYEEKIDPCARHFGLSRSCLRNMISLLKRDLLTSRLIPLVILAGFNLSLVLRTLGYSITCLAGFLRLFLHFNNCSFLTRHFPPYSRWSSVTYGPMGP